MASAPGWLLPLLQEIQGTLRRMEQQMVETQEDCLDVFTFSSFTRVTRCTKFCLLYRTLPVFSELPSVPGAAGAPGEPAFARVQ